MTTKYRYQTVEDVKEAFTEELWYAWKHYENGLVDWSDEVCSEVAHQLTLRGM